MHIEQVCSLPVGPVETSMMWYAVNRLGFNCCVCRCWGRIAGWRVSRFNGCSPLRIGGLRACHEALCRDVI